LHFATRKKQFNKQSISQFDGSGCDFIATINIYYFPENKLITFLFPLVNLFMIQSKYSVLVVLFMKKDFRCM
jgi:hypothetical protein